MKYVSEKIIPFAGCFQEQPGRLENLQKGQLVFLGLSDDSKSSYLRGTAEGPAAIRSAFDGNCYNSTTETGIDLAGMVSDLGDFQDGGEFKRYEETLRQIFRSGAIPFSTGGDHAVTIPVVAALAELKVPVHVIQFDAHPDLYPDYEGDRFSHACTGARILEMDHIASLTQIGIRAMNRNQAEFAARFSSKYHLFEARHLDPDFPRLDHIPKDGAVYLTVDLDGFDPAYAPGVSHLVPGGLSPRQIFSFLQNGHWKLVGMDAVEVNPARDVNGQTAVLAGKILQEGMGFVQEYLRSPKT